MAQITARFKVVAKTPRQAAGNSQNHIVLRGKRQSDGANTENPLLWRDEQGQKQTIELVIDHSQAGPVFTVGKDVVVTFNGPS